MDKKLILMDQFPRWRRIAEDRWVLRFTQAPSFSAGLSLCLRPTPRNLNTCDLIVEIIENSFAPAADSGASSRVATIPRERGRAIYDKLLGVRLGVPPQMELGCDGTTYTLTVNDPVPTMSFTWWGKLPAEWIDLQLVIDDLLAFAREQQSPSEQGPCASD